MSREVIKVGMRLPHPNGYVIVKGRSVGDLVAVEIHYPDWTWESGEVEDVYYSSFMRLVDIAARMRDVDGCDHSLTW